MQTGKKRGFTLLELIIVVVIIGILAGIAIPRFAKTKEKSYSAEAWTNLAAILRGTKIYYLESGTWTTDLAFIPVDNPNNNPVRKFDYTMGSGSGYRYFQATGRADEGATSNYQIRCWNCGSWNEELQRLEKPAGQNWHTVG